MVAKQAGVVIDVIDNHVDLPSMKEVSKGGSAAAVSLQKSRSGMGGNIFETTFSQITAQNHSAPLAELGIPGAHAGRIDGSRHDQEVGMTIVVIIEKSRTPFNRGCLPGQTALRGCISEETATVIMIERWCFIREIGFDDVEQSVSVIISCIDTHATLGTTIGVKSHSSQEARLPEGSVAIIQKKQTRR